MIVIDALVLANLVGDDAAPGTIACTRLEAAGEVSAPDLVDVETVSVVRRRWLNDDLTEARFRSAIDGLGALPIVRFPVAPLMVRGFELRANLTAYDACYVALAEVLNCPLVTADKHLANTPTITCTTQVLHV